LLALFFMVALIRNEVRLFNVTRDGPAYRRGFLSVWLRTSVYQAMASI
jgi:hypothetical protein